MTRIHDYRANTRGWGHDYHLTVGADPNHPRIGGWGTRLRVDDYLLLSHPDGGSVLYRLTTLEYTTTVLDQWFARAEFIRGSGELGRELQATIDSSKPDGPWPHTGWTL